MSICQMARKIKPINAKFRTKLILSTLKSELKLYIVAKIYSKPYPADRATRRANEVWKKKFAGWGNITAVMIAN